jgi:hypothetical protein
VASLRTLNPQVIPHAKAFLAELAQHGIKATVTSTRRDPAQQARLYACFKRVGCSDCTKRPGQPGCFPAAPPGKSTHAVGAAFDLHLAGPGNPYALAGALWERRGFTWGGRFGDRIHFDVRPRVA